MQRRKTVSNKDRPHTLSKEQEERMSRKITYKALEVLVNDENITPSDLAKQLSKESSGFYMTLKEDMQSGMPQMILAVLAKTCKDDVPNESLNFLLKNVLECSFYEKACSFLHNMTMSAKFQKGLGGATEIANCLYLLKAWMIRMPMTSKKQVSMLKLILENAVKKLGLEKHNEVAGIYSEVQEIWKEIQTPKAEQVKQTKKQDQKNNDLSVEHQENPPDDFRQIPVFPQLSDISTISNPFVRTNLVFNAYQNQDHYLDVQYRLLREDFVRPLREGIREYFTAGSQLRKKHAQNIRVYRKVKIEHPYPGPKGMLYCIHFDPNPLCAIEWESSKRLLCGNLVCLSSDKFKRNLLLGTVAQHDPLMLSDGCLSIEIVNSTSFIEIESVSDVRSKADNSDENLDEDLSQHKEENQAILKETLNLPDVEQEYTMVETEAYFEAYQHVLAGLQEIKNIPLEKYLVRCQSTVQSPKYLGNIPQTKKFLFSSVFGTSLSPDKKFVDILNESSWPTAEELNLDDSQKEALINALTREMSIIQGPPGTGKTYIGLIIMKLMLANNFTQMQRSEEQRPHKPMVKEPKNPILVVCYTNHALDQFLEGIAEFHPTGIVRVGGRCKSKKLENLTLTHIRKNSSYYSRTLKDEILKIRKEMEKCRESLEISTTDLLKLETIQHVIPAHLYNQYYPTTNKILGNKAFMSWLGVFAVENAKLDAKFIAYHVCNAFANQLEKMFPRHFNLFYIHDAIIQTESLHFKTLKRWMHLSSRKCHHPPSALPIELIIDILRFLPISEENQFLQTCEYTKVEINCAVLVTKHSENQSPHQWLENNIKFDEDNTFAKTNTANSTRMDKQKHRKALEKEISLGNLESAEGAKDKEWHHVTIKRKYEMKRGIEKTGVMSKESAAHLTDIHELTLEKRWSLYRRWVADYQTNLRQKINKHMLNYNHAVKKLHVVQYHEDREILKQADVIAITTTGAAKHRDIINKLPVKIVIVEEAAEVLEAHIATSMPESTEHLILIGDHQQLKPSPTVYELAVRYNLDVSLFERMIRNGLPYTRLRIQHRMRPRIADLLRIDIYNDLIDHFSVKRYEEVTGVQKSVFFVTHEQLEQSVADGRSKINQHEANYMVAFCQYLLCQEYEPRQITILATYTGQLLAFKRIMTTVMLHEDVRVTAVDNFQGEENDIILLSLVRSNEEQRIGFLKVENRICVALSRAKIGLYCIGNFTNLQAGNALWRNIVRHLKSHDQFGTSLPLHCKNHPNHVTQAAVANDFAKVPEGGCGKPCEFRLPCGHRCTRSCHPDDEDHTKFKCYKPCLKKCAQGHKCPLKCHEDCRNCLVTVKKTIPSCCHQQDVPCYQDPETFDCNMPCTKLLSCSHKCDGFCGGRCTTNCMVEVPVNSPCGHEIKVPCYMLATPHVDLCKEKCNVMLKCGHYCQGSCCKCSQGRLHERCKQTCNRLLVCGHTCKMSCSQNCPPCSKKCTAMCEHKKCWKKCWQPCDPCRKKCEWKCEHHSCTKLCCEPCDRPPCNLPCPKKIKRCGHTCIGLCGEPCPKLCRICDKDKVTEIFFGDEDKEDARFVELEDCKHIFTYEGLDTWMNQNSNEEDVEIALKECPRCNAPIRKSRRYGMIVNKQLELINVVKMKIVGDQREINAERQKVLSLVRNDKQVKQLYSMEIRRLIQKLHWERIKTLDDVQVAKVRYLGLSRLAELQNKCRRRESFITIVFFGEWERENFKESCGRLFSWLTTARDNFSQQEVDDLDRELLRLEQCAALLRPIPSAKNVFMKCSEEEMLADLLFRDLSPYSKAKEAKVKKYIEEIKILRLKYAWKENTDDETRMIVSAINLSKGHWYKCKNGHVYAIGERGGATEKSKCPECQENLPQEGVSLS